MRYLLLALLLAGCIDPAEARRPPRQRGRGSATIAGFANTTSLDLDGVNEYTQAASDDESLECDDEDKLTICSWFKLDTAADGPGVFGKFDSGFSWRGYTYNTSGSNYGIQFEIGSTSNGCKLPNVGAQGNWVHLCLVYDGSQADNSTRLLGYVGGVASTCTYFGTVPATMNNIADKMSWGATTAGGYQVWGPGNVDEFALWCSALSAAQVATVYNNGKAGNLNKLGAAEFRVWLRLDADTHPTVINRANGATVNFTATNTEAADFIADVP